jgi:hypothetical protein
MVDLKFTGVGDLATTAQEQSDRPTVLHVLQDGPITLCHFLITTLAFANIEKEIALSSIGISVAFSDYVIREDDHIR